MANGQFTTVLIEDPQPWPSIEARHVTVLPRSPLDTLRLLWREGHVKDLGLTALTGAVATVSAYFSATADDDTVRAANGATSGFTGAFSLAGLGYSIKGIRATLARDDHQRAEAARLARTEYLESMEEQRKTAEDQYHERRLAADKLPVEGRRLVTSAPVGKGNTEVTVYSLGPIEWNPVTGRRIEPAEAARHQQEARATDARDWTPPPAEESPRAYAIPPARTFIQMLMGEEPLPTAARPEGDQTAEDEEAFTAAVNLHLETQPVEADEAQESDSSTPTPTPLPTSSSDDEDT